MHMAALPDNNNHHNHQQQLVQQQQKEKRPKVRHHSGLYPLSLSASWHSNLAGSCSAPGSGAGGGRPGGHSNSTVVPVNGRTPVILASSGEQSRGRSAVAPDFDSGERPKRARSISTQHRVQVSDLVGGRLSL